MSSIALSKWTTLRSAGLNEIELAHRSVGGSGPGRRYATQQINCAYAVLLAAHFQGFCRDLYVECAEALVRSITPEPFRAPLRSELLLHVRLDRGNATPGNLGSDFGRFGLSFWAAVKEDDGLNDARRASLEGLNEWRNAIVHQSFSPERPPGAGPLRLQQVRNWRSNCDRLSESFDRVMQAHLVRMTGANPW
jgi:hypothetical protein